MTGTVLICLMLNQRLKQSPGLPNWPAAWDHPQAQPVAKTDHGCYDMVSAKGEADKAIAARLSQHGRQSWTAHARGRQ